MLVDVSKPLCTLTMEGARVSFLVPSMKDAEKICETIATTGKPFEIELREHKTKRSKSANALMWALLGEMCAVMNRGGEIMDINYMYRTYIRSSNNYVYAEVWDDDLRGLEKSWSSNGIAWFVDIVDVDESEQMKRYSVRLYYGSSQYDTKQMARLIDNILQDAAAMGVDSTSENFRSLMEMYPYGQ